MVRPSPCKMDVHRAHVPRSEEASEEASRPATCHLPSCPFHRLCLPSCLFLCLCLPSRLSYQSSIPSWGLGRPTSVPMRASRPAKLAFLPASRPCPFHRPWQPTGPCPFLSPWPSLCQPPAVFWFLL